MSIARGLQRCPLAQILRSTRVSSPRSWNAACSPQWRDTTQPRPTRVMSTARRAALEENGDIGIFEDVLLECNRITTLAHSLWARVVRTGDTVVDATCGNGHDTLLLAKLALRTHGEGAAGRVVGIDVSAAALEATRRRLAQHIPEAELARVDLRLESHEHLAASIPSARLVVFNLGFLPGVGDDRAAAATQAASTLAGLRAATSILERGGLVSVMGYTGHAGGAEEVAAVVEYLQTLDPDAWTVSQTALLNRSRAPSLILAYRRMGRQFQGQRQAAGSG